MGAPRQRVVVTEIDSSEDDDTQTWEFTTSNVVLETERYLDWNYGARALVSFTADQPYHVKIVPGRRTKVARALYEEKDRTWAWEGLSDEAKQKWLDRADRVLEALKN